MALREETEQAGITLNYPVHHDDMRARARHVICLLVAIVLAIILPSLSGCTMAEASTVPSAKHARNTASASATSASSEASYGTTMTIDSITPVVTSSSGYHLRLTLHNVGTTTNEAGTLTVSTNVFYTFVSRTDMQDWAQGQSRIPMHDQLAQTNVGAIAAHGTATVNVDIDASSPQLAAITNWGPKPVRITYTPGAQADGTHLDGTSLHTFLTRSSDGLKTADTPAMGITIVQPLASKTWQTNTASVTNMLNAESSWLNSRSVVDAISPAGDIAKTERAQSQLLAKHAKLQVLADPSYLQAMAMPAQTTAIMQPGMFDITAYAALDSPDKYTKAGVNTSDWDASASVSAYRSAVGSTTSTRQAIALQGHARWTQRALNIARQAGYSTVIATSGYGSGTSGTVYTGKYDVSTDSGDITVLVAQQELTGLARGKATSSEADSETSDAGRLSRFIAQSAFYQMEQPYTSRNLLVCLDEGTSTAFADSLMSALEQSSWLNLTDLNTLMDADAYRSGQSAAEYVPQSSGLGASCRKRLEAALSAFSQDVESLKRFKKTVLSSDVSASSSSTPGSTASETSSSSDEQPLARHDANKIAQTKATGPSTWISCLSSLQSRMALFALSGDTSLSQRMADDAAGLSSKLFGNITITPTDTVTVVSETAKLPVTVSNAGPYPVRVRVSSLTDSMEIVTNRYADVTVPARGEAQVTFTIRVATSGTTNVHLSLQDQAGKDFSSPQTTTITSSLQISDKTGIAFIIVAVLLGVLGLWRQFNRKKDPDE